MNQKGMYKRRGISLSGLLITSVILILVAIFGLRLVPVYLEYTAIKKNLTAIAQDPNLQQADLNQIRLSFSKRAQVDSIKSISGQDIKINKENNRIILSAKYTAKIPLVENISLNIDFEAISD